MSTAYDFVVAGVIICISVAIHLISVYLFAPGTTLHVMASEATIFSGAAKADLWYQILAQWVPAGGLFVACAWPFVRAYRKTANTAAQRVR